MQATGGGKGEEGRRNCQLGRFLARWVGFRRLIVGMSLVIGWVEMEETRRTDIAFGEVRMHACVPSVCKCMWSCFKCWFAASLAFSFGVCSCRLCSRKSCPRIRLWYLSIQSQYGNACRILFPSPDCRSIPLPSFCTFPRDMYYTKRQIL